jgi:hypothetical protein
VSWVAQQARLEMLARRIEPIVRLRPKEGAFGRALGIHPRLGLPVFALLDLATPLPAGFAFARFCFERDADRVAWRHALAAGASPTAVRKRAAEFAAHAIREAA